MTTINEISKDILATTWGIQKDFPEQSSYITEMAVTIPDEANPEITTDNLNEYSESLNALVAKYSKEKK